MSKSSPGAVSLVSESRVFREDGTEDPDQGNQAVITHRWVNSVSYGENIPGWRQLLREGRDATTSLSGTSMVAQVVPGRLDVKIPIIGIPSRYYRRTSTGILGNTTGLPLGDPSSLDITTANAQALGRLHQRIFESRTAVMGGVILGELGQTIRMFRNPAQGLRREVDNWLEIARRLRRKGTGSPSGIATTTRNLADAWLEAQFGWRPFLHDVADSAKALGQFNRGRGIDTITFRTSGKSDLPSSESSELASTNVPGGGGVTIYYLIDSVHEYRTEVRYRAAMRVEAKNPKEFDPTLIGFDLRSWGPTIWELIPYSFLIDYFSNVGDIITGWSNLGVRMAWCNRTARRIVGRRQWTKLHPSFNTGVNATVSHTPAKYIIESRSVSRTKITELPNPGLELEIPDIGSLKWLNIAALIASRDNDRHWSYD